MVAQGSGHTLYSLLCEDHWVYEKTPIGEPCEKNCCFGTLLASALDNYFTRGNFTPALISLHPVGTPFQNQVWQALKNVPLGETRSYRDIATILGRPTAARAVANACKQNPYTLIIPCHRIIGSRGKLAGYAGGFWRKEWLLKFEKLAIRLK